MDIYNKLTQPGISALVLAGIGGIGKSTLAALLYRYVEAKHPAGNSPFAAPSLWLRVEQALSLHREIGNRQWESVILNNIGAIYLYLLKDEHALRSFGQAWRIEQEVGNRVDEGVTLGNIGTLFFKKNQYRTALACLLLAQSIFQEVKMAHRSITSWMASISEKLGDEQFAALEAEVKPMAWQIVDQVLRAEN